MDFDLSRLDARNLEQLTQSLAQDSIGAHLSIFGDGPDGGREASWEGSSEDQWAGYGVLQCKAKIDPGSSVASNLRWLKSQITAEAARWRDSTQTRRSPAHYLLATNVKLSASPGNGIDAAKTHLLEQFAAAGYPIAQATIWSYQEIRALLENNTSVRTSYSAWILPGDIISRLYEDAQSRETATSASLGRYVASCLTRDLQLKLNQTGTVRDQPIGVAQVFIDVPFQIRYEDESLNESLETLPGGIAEHLIMLADKAPHRESTDERGSRQKRLALVGGPGQGKSTVTQFLAQLYRASFLKDFGVDLDDDTRRAAQATFSRAEEIGLPLPSGRRWPVRVVLPDLADALSSGATRSVLQHIAQEVSSKANADIDQNDLLRWLQAYPWIVMFDGLDEVPSSANRAELIAALRDFYSAAKSVDADLITISTTRPQGYDGEYGKVEHIDLIPLPQSVALEFADTFLEARNGAGADINDRTKALLRQAIQQPATQRLFESPLQATILAILIERLGHAPGDRWRLFSSYYQVITQREQEKTGELSALLQTYSSEIDYLHRAVGRLLQERGEGVGGARGVLSRDELEGLIQERLLEIGHSQADSNRLASDFMRLATERLVFLAMLTAETAGFEIRSMQEFMAAEQITQDFSDDNTFLQLRGIASSPYWSNVVRFAAGRIFATREMLKPIVLQLCQDLEAETNPIIVKRGRSLALEILSDGVVDTQPRYALPLADHAARLFSSWDEKLIPALARVANAGAQGRIDEAARSAAKNGGVSAALAAVYAGIRQRSDPSFSLTPAAIWEAQSDRTQVEILRLAWISGDRTLRELAEGHLGEHEPRRFMSGHRRLMPLPGQSDDAHTSAWDALAHVSKRSFRREHIVQVLVDGNSPGVSASFVALDQNRQLWAAISTVTAELPRVEVPKQRRSHYRWRRQGRSGTLDSSVSRVGIGLSARGCHAVGS
ncbi:NACHT domain-containing protein [Curtobacterium flaccumfaciens]